MSGAVLIVGPRVEHHLVANLLFGDERFLFVLHISMRLKLGFVGLVELVQRIVLGGVRLVITAVVNKRLATVEGLHCRTLVTLLVGIVRALVHRVLLDIPVHFIKS